jgi:hypothetical protein
MSTTTLTFYSYKNGILTDAESVVLASPDSSYGVRDADTLAILVSSDTVMTKIATGVYTYVITDSETDLQYEYWIEVVYDSVAYNHHYIVNGTTAETILVEGTNAYVTIDDADTYFSGRLPMPTEWIDANTNIRERAIVTATRILERLNWADDKNVEDQVLQFPRGDDTTIPTDIKYACSEIALALLEGCDPELDFQNLWMTSQGYGNIRATFNREQLPNNISAGVPSSIAWRYILPYLRDSRTFTLSRSS